MMVIVDTGLANILSVVAAFERLGVTPHVTDEASDIASADHVVFPGVGAASPAMKKLQDKGLDIVLPSLTQPVLGICLGMQLLFEASEESDAQCLNIIPGRVKRLQPHRDLPVPHMGWNRLCFDDVEHPLFENIADGSHVYYVHSYAADIASGTLARTTYGTSFTAVVQHRNFYGCQFHPERSGPAGQQILQNLLKL